MFRLPDKHPILNRAVLWPIFLFSTAVFVPIVLAKSLPSGSESVTVIPSATPSPQAPSPQAPPAELIAEREWRQRLVSQSLSSPPKTTTPKTTTASASSSSKTAKQPSSKSQTSQSQAQATKPQTNPKQQQQKSQRSTKANTPSPQHASHPPAIEIRVAVSTGERSLVVGTSTSGEVLDAQGKVLGKLAASEGKTIEPAGSNIRIGDWETAAGVWIKATQDGFVSVGGNWFRGDLLVVSQGDTLVAVNYVDLEKYLASVVASEVSPSWPMDALKAQAIAARSYALVHYLRPAHALYDLGNTQRWQVYKGIKSEWNTTTQAVKDTSGVFLSYKGGVVESMYAASDDIVMNVFQGRGMSQLGALNLAQQGYNYQQILSNYYPGVSLAVLDTKASDPD